MTLRRSGYDGSIPLVAVGMLVSLVVIPASSARAGAYHAGETSYCADCHLQSGPATGAAPSRMELVSENVPELCLRCHDGRPGIPDVMGDDINNLTERSGGFFAPVDAGNPRGHELSRRATLAAAESGCGLCHAPAGPLVSPWNASAQHGGLSCTDCHDPHGNNNPRNLRLPSAPADPPSFGLFIAAGTRGLDRYERRNVCYGTLGSDRSREVSALCLDCHGTFGGADGRSPGGHRITHPSYDSQRGNTNTIAQGAARGATDPGHWVRGDGSGFDGTSRVPFLVPGARDFASASVVDPARNGVFCLSCHKAHGSGSAFGLTWTSRERGIGPRGCDQCHGLAALPPGDAPAGSAGATASRAVLHLQNRSE
jgi:hypothetical protein